MTTDEFRLRASSLPSGKRVSGAVYVHVDGLVEADPDLYQFVMDVGRRVRCDLPWNVVKLDTRTVGVSLLHYPSFRDEEHPSLVHSVTIDLATLRSKTRVFSSTRNPPILHRKETMISEKDPDFARFRNLTLQEEAAGLFARPTAIGHRAGWDETVKQCGVRIEAHSVLREEPIGADQERITVHRHRTAITRIDLSRPVQLLLSFGLLSKEDSLLDYGCGQGDDVRFLTELQYRASGWDPVFFPDRPLDAADVVNLGYVLNVIEDLHERKEALRKAYSLAKRLLCVSVLVGTTDYSGRVRPFGDGVVTSKGTFQKYFEQEELLSFVADTLDAEAVPASVGVFLIFRGRTDQQQFLLGRVQRRAVPTARALGLRRSETVRRAVVEAFRERHRELWTAYSEFVRTRGRPPHSDESPLGTTAREFGVRADELYEVARTEVSEAALAETAAIRRNEIVVFLAICRFRGTPKLSDLPRELQRDIRFHFGAYKNAQVASDDALLATGDRGRISRLCASAPYGVNTADGFFVPRKLLSSLDPTLQIYARLGELFSGDLESIDIIKIHKTSPKLTLFRMDDYENQDEPRLELRTKIDLQAQRIRYFDHRSDTNPEILFGKALMDHNPSDWEDSAESVLARRLIASNPPFGLIVRRSAIPSE